MSNCNELLVHTPQPQNPKMKESPRFPVEYLFRSLTSHVQHSKVPNVWQGAYACIMILSYWGAILIVKIVSGVKKFPAVELCHGTCPLGQQSEAPQTHFHQHFVVGIRSWDARVRSERGGHLRTIPESDKDVQKVLFCVWYLESSQAYLMWSSRIFSRFCRRLA